MASVYFLLVSIGMSFIALWIFDNFGNGKHD